MRLALVEAYAPDKKFTFDVAVVEAREQGGTGANQYTKSKGAIGPSAKRTGSGPNSKDRLLGRIKRERPDIAERYANGEFTSARAAAIEAGIVNVLPRNHMRVAEVFAKSLPGSDLGDVSIDAKALPAFQQRGE